MYKITRRSTNSSFPSHRFFKDEDAAVTVDWVVLSATLVVMGAIVIGVYRGAVYNVASAIEDSVVESASGIPN